MFLRRPRTASAPGRVPGAGRPVLGAAESLPAPRGARRRGEATVRPTIAVLQQILDEYGLLHSIDSDGDLAVRWDTCTVYFFHYGEQEEVLQARLYLNRRHDVDSRAALMSVLDDWNRTRLFPKAYTVLPDDGMVGVCAEVSHDFRTGVTRDQLTYTVGSWVQTLLRFADWVDEQV